MQEQHEDTPCAILSLPSEVWQNHVLHRLGPWSKTQLRCACKEMCRVSNLLAPQTLTCVLAAANDVCQDVKSVSVLLRSCPHTTGLTFVHGSDPDIWIAPTQRRQILVDTFQALTAATTLLPGGAAIQQGKQQAGLPLQAESHNLACILAATAQHFPCAWPPPATSFTKSLPGLQRLHLHVYDMPLEILQLLPCSLPSLQDLAIHVYSFVSSEEAGTGSALTHALQTSLPPTLIKLQVTIGTGPGLLAAVCPILAAAAQIPHLSSLHIGPPMEASNGGGHVSGFLASQGSWCPETTLLKPLPPSLTDVHINAGSAGSALPLVPVLLQHCMLALVRLAVTVPQLLQLPNQHLPSLRHLTLFSHHTNPEWSFHHLCVLSRLTQVSSLDASSSMHLLNAMLATVAQRHSVQQPQQPQQPQPQQQHLQHHVQPVAHQGPLQGTNPHPPLQSLPHLCHIKTLELGGYTLSGTPAEHLDRVLCAGVLNPTCRLVFHPSFRLDLSAITATTANSLAPRFSAPTRIATKIQHSTSSAPMPGLMKLYMEDPVAQGSEQGTAVMTVLRSLRAVWPVGVLAGLLADSAVSPSESQGWLLGSLHQTQALVLGTESSAELRLLGALIKGLHRLPCVTSVHLLPGSTEAWVKHQEAIAVSVQQLMESAHKAGRQVVVVMEGASMHPAGLREWVGRIRRSVPDPDALLMT